MSTYNKTVWQDGDIITADKMNNIENGIYSYNEDLNALSTATSEDVGKALKAKTVTNGKVTEWEFGVAGGADPAEIEQAVEDYLDEHPVVASAAGVVSVADYGAVGDGVTDDSAAVQSAIDDNYDVYFESGKTYYLASTVTIDHDCKLHGGLNTTIKTKTPPGGVVNNAFNVQGTLKKTTTLTTDYVSNGSTDNSNNRFTLSDMTGIDIGDVMVITATDQYYSYARQYYYLGATLLITDIYDGHIYSCDSMPWDIENTANVSVKIYDAPSVVVENLHFESDLDSRGNYRYLLKLYHCKNSTIKDCTFTQMDNGIHLHECVNTLVSNVSFSKSKYDNALSGDGYGLAIYSCTDTIVERMLATCAQHAITISGSEPSMNTRVRNCDLTAECRVPGFDCHENAYNTVLEDCVLGTATLHGTAHVNRCKIINNRRANNGITYLTLNGSHNPEWARFRITDTVFEGTGIYLTTHSVQTPIQAFDNIWGSIEIENCLGGDELVFCPVTSESILSNRLQNLVIKNWKNCRGINYNGDSPIDFLNIIDSTFRETNFISDRNPSHGVVTDGIKYFDLSNVYPSKHKISVDADTYGEAHTLPKDTRIQLSSDNSSAIFRICGTNLTPDIRDDYMIGSVAGPDGGEISRSNYTGSNVTLTIDNNGDPVFAQASNSTSKYAFYPIGMFYVSEASTVEISAKVKNTGNTNGAGFYPTIAILDCETGLLISRASGTLVTASADGVSMSYARNVNKGRAVLCYCYCNSPIAGSETTFEDFSITCTPLFAPNVVDDQYHAKRLTGNGTILSLEGVNNIMCSETIFHVKFQADLLK